MNILRRAASITTAAIIAAALAACKGDARPNDGGQVVVTGSSTVSALMVEIGARFEQENPSVRVDVQAGGTARGIADVHKGLADIGMVSRAVKDERLQVFTIARDGISLVVHDQNGIDELTRKQVLDVYTGGVDNWKQLGGHDAPITVINKAEGRATLLVFLEWVGLRNTQIQADVVVGHNEHVLKTVAGNPDAIGYVSIGAAEYDTERGAPIKLLPIDGIEASTEAVERGDFPLTRSLNLVTRRRPEGLADELIDYAQSDDVHDLIRRQYFAPASR